MEPEQTPPPAPTNRKKVATRTKVALWLLLGPTVLLVATFILFAVANLAFGNIPQTLPEACETSSSSLFGDEITPECEQELFGLQSPAEQAINVILFLIGTVGVIAWVPGLVIGIILLATKRETPQTPAQ
jgi:hypothetical protein